MLFLEVTGKSHYNEICLRINSKGIFISAKLELQHGLPSANL